MNDEEYKALKVKAVDLLHRRITDRAAYLLEDIDPRCLKWITDIDAAPEWHNLWQIASTAKQLRILSTYPVIKKKVIQIYRAIEGVWEDGIYKRGGFKLESIRGNTHYQLTPMQAYIFAFLYGPHHYVDLGPAPHNVHLMPTECIGPDGHLLDLRRVTRNAIIFVPRKNAKSDLASDVAIIDFFFGDTNGEVMLCSNSQDQSDIIFQMIYKKLHQLDPDERRIRFTTKEINWRHPEKRSNAISAMSAGGKTKDGHHASVVLEDEYGSAQYTNGHSDMASLCQVSESSMGPRREPLIITTTTAGNSINGPFQVKLDGEKQDLIREIELALMVA